MLYQSQDRSITLALAGDVMLTRKISVNTEDAFLGVRDALSGADAAFANLETTVRHPNEGTPNVTVGTHTTMPPELLDELKWLGISIVSTANNHAYDYGELGILATGRHLGTARIPFAGTGENLALAQAPAYCDTPAGRVALVATTATFRPWNRASEQGPRMGGRPGINPFGFTVRHDVDAEAFAALERIATELGFHKARRRDLQHFFSEKDLGPASAGRSVNLAGQTFVASDGFGIGKTAEPEDVERNLAAIREARRQADWVVMSFHSHEFSGEDVMTAESRKAFRNPPGFFRDFAHAAIEAGADVVAGHGTHTLLGVEIYKDRPIFYGLGNLVFMNETVDRLPLDAFRRFDLPYDAAPADFLDARTDNDRKGHPANPDYWRAAVARCRFTEGKLADIVLHPVDLGHGTTRAQRGRPCLASGRVAEEIVERLRDLSAAFGTTIKERDGRAFVDLKD